MKRLFKIDKVMASPRTLGPDYLIVVFLLVGVGLSFLFTASYHFSASTSGNPYRMVFRQGMWIALGAVIAFLVSRLSREQIKKYIPHAVILTFLLNCLTYLPFVGRSAGGAQRWIGITLGPIDLSFQPSELIKIVLVLYLARQFEKKQETKNDFLHSILPPMIISLLFVLVVFFQNDFSTAVYIFTVAFFMFFIADVKLSYLALVLVVFAAGALLMVMMKDFRMQRLVYWLHPENDPLDKGYQILRARNALRSGRFWGRGLGAGLAKQGRLPQSYSDFIAAVIGEETGLAGIIGTLALYSTVWFKGSSVFFSEGDLFSRYSAAGLSFAVFFQALVNLGVASGLFPATGIPLPLFSSGGSAALPIARWMSE